jgi:branched-chain amino acid transport system ATP-binding protein
MTERAAAAPNLLELEGVHTHIGRYHILHGVDLAVPEGGLTMLLGRNGAGKTTTLRTVMGLWQASAGLIRFAGIDITGWTTPDIARLGIAYVPETMGIFTQLTVRENMLLATALGRFDGARLDSLFALFPVLKQKWDQQAGGLSGGQKQMLAIGRAVVERRRLLVVDEPTKGLAPAVIEHLIAGFQALKAARATILLVEQNFHLARSLGDGVAVMDDGRIVSRGRMADLAADEALQARLLGLSLAAHQ